MQRKNTVSHFTEELWYKEYVPFRINEDSFDTADDIKLSAVVILLIITNPVFKNC